MYLKIDIKDISPKHIEEIAEALEASKVIAYPTDTIYGLGCLATDSQAIKKIKRIKQREASKPLLVLVSSLAMAKKYCFIPKNKELLLKKIWAESRPTSVILKHRNLLSEELVKAENGLAVRLPKSEFLRKIVRRVKVPLVSTSFNISGEPVVDRVDNYRAARVNKNAPDLIVDGGILKGEASRLLDLRGEELIILRK